MKRGGRCYEHWNDVGGDTMRVLVTGAGGFVGTHLVKELLARGHNVYEGTKINDNSIGNIEHLVYLDLNNMESIKYALLISKPDAIVHLAAQSNVPLAWEDPEKTITVNTIGTVNLIEVVSKISPHTKILTAGSSEEYGITAKYIPYLSEADPCFPQNPFASSKLAVCDLVMQLSAKYQLNTIHVRSFNPFGPGQRKGFVISDIASQIAEIEYGSIPPIISVGNLNTYHDFTDVRDVAEAYTLLLESNTESGIYNVCSGIPRSLSDILNTLLSFTTAKIDVTIDNTQYSPTEIEKMVGNNNKIRSRTNWELKRNFENSLVETLEWWREEIKKDQAHHYSYFKAN